MKRTAWTRLSREPGAKQHRLHYDMEVHYSRQIDRVRVEFGPSVAPDILMMAHVQLVIWGCLMVESFANRFRRGQLAEKVSLDVLDHLWERHFAREKTEEKLAKAAKRFPAVAPPAWLASELVLRDRLVHYKDRPVMLSLAKYRKEWERAGSPGELLEHLPPMGIEAALIGTPLATRKDRFLEYGDTLQAASGELAKIRGAV